MERLTRKDIYDEGYELDGCGCLGNYMPTNDAYPDMIDKLGEIEDIEEELGCPLNILKPNQIVSFVKDDVIYDREIMGVNIQDKTIMVGSSWSFNSLPLNLYGKTWWLKEDKLE